MPGSWRGHLDETNHRHAGRVPIPSSAQAADRPRRTTDLTNNSLRRVYDLLRSAQRRDLTGPEQQLSEDRLAKELAASRNTVRAALQQMASEGRLVRQRRSGTSLAGAVMSWQLDPVHATAPVLTTVLSIETLRAPAAIARRLGLEDGTPVTVVEDLVSVDDEPLGVRSTYLPSGACASPAVLRTTPNVYDLLAGAGVEVGATEIAVEAIVPDPQTTRLLRMSPGGPVLWRELLVHDAGSRPVALVFAHYRGDRVSLLANQGPDPDRRTPEDRR